MILIAGTIDVNPEKRDAAIEAGRPHMEATRNWKGCLDYVWSADPLQDDRIYVFERWETEADLAAHFKGPHYLAMRETIASFEIRGLDILKYRNDVSEPVYDSKGVPRADFFTI